MDKAEFLYKVKPKLQNQFKAAEVNLTPLSVIIGEDEIAQGKVKLKENGLPKDHPEKEGILVNISDLVSEIKQRLKRIADLDSLTREAEGLRVVGGIRGEPAIDEPAPAVETPAESVKAASETKELPPPTA